VVDHQIGRNDRIDLCRIAPQSFDPVSHRGQVDNGGNAGEVLQDDPRRHERNVRPGVCGTPRRDRLDVFLANVLSARMAQSVLQQDSDREREPIERGYESPVLQAGKAVEGRWALRKIDGREGAEGILSCSHVGSW
jgi:hypothetical protein